MEDVGGGTVVDDNHVFKVSVQAREVLHKNPIEERAVLAEEAERRDAVLVKEIEQRIRVLRETRSVDDDLVEIRESLEELIHAGPLEYLQGTRKKVCSLAVAGFCCEDTYVDVADVPFNFDWQHEVGRIYRLEAAVHQGFVEVEHERFKTSVVFLLRPNYDFVHISHLLEEFDAMKERE